jgi:hypothetical protein
MTIMMYPMFSFISRVFTKNQINCTMMIKTNKTKTLSIIGELIMLISESILVV